jgi:hypothetical protein
MHDDEISRSLARWGVKHYPDLRSMAASWPDCFPLARLAIRLINQA